MAQRDRKLRVVVLMGGQSPEHDVSLSTGRQVVGALDRARYRVKAAVVGREGGWLVPPGWEGEIPAAGEGDGPSGPLTPGGALERLREEAPDVVFLALHGPFGEDGTVQGMLELAGLRYTGSGVLGSAQRRSGATGPRRSPGGCAPRSRRCPGS
jgi:D-alanine-D-alanine ligase